MLSNKAALLKGLQQAVWQALKQAAWTEASVTHGQVAAMTAAAAWPTLHDSWTKVGGRLCRLLAVSDREQGSSSQPQLAMRL